MSETPTSRGVERRPGDNPAPQPFGVTVSYPEDVEIRLVDASGLSDYETWFFLSGMMSNFATGFWVAYVTAAENVRGVLLAVALLFTGFLVLFVIKGLVERARLRRRIRRYEAPLGQLTPKDANESTR